MYTFIALSTNTDESRGIRRNKDKLACGSTFRGGAVVARTSTPGALFKFPTQANPLLHQSEVSGLIPDLPGKGNMNKSASNLLHDIAQGWNRWHISQRV